MSNSRLADVFTSSWSILEPGAMKTNSKAEDQVFGDQDLVASQIPIRTTRLKLGDLILLLTQLFEELSDICVYLTEEKTSTGQTCLKKQGPKPNLAMLCREWVWVSNCLLFFKPVDRNWHAKIKTPWPWPYILYQYLLCLWDLVEDLSMYLGGPGIFISLQ